MFRPGGLLSRGCAGARMWLSRKRAAGGGVLLDDHVGP